jgi:hypothetical protein
MSVLTEWLELNEKMKVESLDKIRDEATIAFNVTENADGTATITMSPQPPRKYKVWRRLDEAERQNLSSRRMKPEECPELIAKGVKPENVPCYTPENSPDLFSPIQRLGFDLADLNAKIDAFYAKNKRLPRGVTLWDAPPPRNEDLPTPKLEKDAIAALLKTLDESENIPPFDASVMNGIYKRFVDVCTRGTTMSPQFIYSIAKTIVGAKMAGKVKFENLDVEPRFYTALIGESGSGKGESWRRVFQVLNVEGQVGNVAGLKIINSADSGAGIRDAFFEQPEDAPMLMYIDEVESFGNKASATRNPAIMDMLIELADSTQISRVKASSKGSKSKTKNDARLCAVMCGQDGLVYMKSFAGRTKLGLWDRLTPEYAEAVEAGDLPPISTQDAFQLLIELKQLDYSGTMTMAVDAKAKLDAFWTTQPGDVKKKARWKKNLTLDAYMSAFGRGSKVAEVSDVEIAIRIFLRQLIIRRICFTTEVPDRTGYYLGLIKALTESMRRQLNAGIPWEQVALSRRNYERRTNAARDNEEHLFSKAWEIHSKVWLTPVNVKKTNGHQYTKFLPIQEEGE